MVPNERNELIPTRTVIGWCMCIDYRRLNKAIRKDHFPLPFMDQILERLTGHGYYCFLDGYLAYNQIVGDPKDQEKTSFTCPYGVFAYRHMPFSLCNAPATFQRECMQALEELKSKLSSAPIIGPPSWELPFELMCDKSDFSISAVLPYSSKVVVFIDHAALKYLLTKQEPKPRLIRWIILLQQFNIEIKDRSGVENKVADHLSRIPHMNNEAHSPGVKESFPNEQLMIIQEAPWCADIANFKAIGELPSNINNHLRRKLINDIKHFIWDEPYLFKTCVDRI
ncbi:uncharacterized protein [Arachis hypogaea]|uniref:uncharacterized protein n=1 Tax=Arachis hypogaea TaxID=3818 RepID=UPI003B225699